MGKSQDKSQSQELKYQENKELITEKETTFYHEWSAGKCLDHLAEYVNSFHNKDRNGKTRYVTRNRYRRETGVSDSTWDRYFGTFHEFRRQARVELSRQQHTLERNIARHASVDQYRRMSERSNWGDNYIRSTDNRWKTILFFSDLHDIEIDPFYLRVLIDVAKRANPDVVSAVGDIFDLYEFGKYTIDPRNFDVVGRIKFVHNNILKPLRSACPDAQFDLIEGNHEARLLRHLADSTPAMKVLLSDLHGMTIPDLLGLHKFEINYISQADLGAFNSANLKEELKKNYRVYYDCVLAHHFPQARHRGMAGVNGHHHSHKVWSSYSEVFGSYEWHQMGAGHRRMASYCDGSTWNNGFALCHIDAISKNVVFEYIDIGESHAVAGGKFYYRREDEI